MAEDKQDPVVDPVPQPTNDVEFLEQLKEIKEKMVDKAEFDKISEDNRKLKEALMHSLSKPQEDNSASAKQLAEEYLNMASKDENSLEMAKKALAFREQVLKETNGSLDVFMNDDVRKNDPLRGDKVAQFLTEAVRQSNGSVAIFNAFLSSNLRESDTSKAINIKLQNNK